MFTSLPAWLRWLILLPVALVGGWVVAQAIYVLNTSQAARPDAPIMYIADFVSSIASNYVAFYLAHAVAPRLKERVVAILVITAVLASLYTIYLVIERDVFIELVGVAGNLVGCVLGWRKFVVVKTHPEMKT